jgi:hypothetical protein
MDRCDELAERHGDRGAAGLGAGEEHLRQHRERSTAGGRATLAREVALSDGAPRARHLLFAYDDSDGDSQEPSS